MGASSKNKGSKAEREVAELVQAWWRLLEPEAEFARTPMSGAWRGASDQARSDLQLVGDLMTNARRWPFVVEVKRREGWCPDRFVSGKKSPAMAWWEGCCEDARTAGKEPILFARRSRMPWLVVIRRECAARAGIDFGHQLPDRVAFAFDAFALQGIHPERFAVLAAP